jgi:heme/copper-type cytochrome/quinol oxidase subunit 1
MCQLKAIKVLIALTSSLAVAGGFVIMGWTFYMIISTQWLSSGIPSQLTNIAQIVAAVAITIGGLGVLYGIAGLATLKFRHVLILSSYGIVGFLLTAIYTLAAIALVYLYNVKTGSVDSFCKGNLTAGIHKLQPYVNNLQNQTA